MYWQCIVVAIAFWPIAHTIYLILLIEWTGWRVSDWVREREGEGEKKSEW